MNQHIPAGPAFDPVTGSPLPAPVPPRRSWFSRHKVLTALGVVAALVVVISIATSGGSEPGAGPTAADGAAAEPGAGNAAPAAAGVGTPVRDGKFEFTVTQVETGVARIGNDVIGQDAQGQFVLLHLTVANIGNEAQLFDGSSQKLVDTAGRTHSSDAGAVIYLDDANSFLNQINPGNAVTGVVVFDVPVDAVPASAELHDSPFSGGVTVALE